ncbi:hypothetical protein RHGRI_027081 [Rhododendron griersonianum]|uniref:GDSL esterase/lipase n=1 Tax=Rhododendron griersonianum TaxID=479676 RepID=A0AAV6IVT4_9ERIC|nr:hypothetical protein RHGRI_027081 [Rhododendron griersonianum]
MEPMGALFLIIFLSASPCCTRGNVELAPALYIFGDSTVDGGNNVPADNKAFGIDLNNTSVPPRCTNGLTVADFFGRHDIYFSHLFSHFFAIDQSLPNLAVPYEFNEVYAPPIMFCYSVFFVSFGINDYYINYLWPNNGTLKTLTPELFAQFLLNELAARLRTLYHMGGRKFVVNNIWPIGCSPGYSSSSCCDETINKKLFPYNDTLPAVLMKLQAELHGSFFSCSDDFQFVADLRSNVEEYGMFTTILFDPYVTTIFPLGSYST